MTVERRDRLTVRACGTLVVFLDHDLDDHDEIRPVGLSTSDDPDDPDEVVWPSLDDVEETARRMLSHVANMRTEVNALRAKAEGGDDAA